VLLAAVAVVGVLATTRTQGRLKLLSHDLMVNAQNRQRVLPDPGVMIVGVTERDQRIYGDRPKDAVLADALQRILAADPIVAGIDFFRSDVPVGPLGAYPDLAGFRRLSTLLQSDPRLVVILNTGMFPDRAAIQYSQLAPFLDLGDRLVSAEMVTDEADRVVRRGLLASQTEDLWLWSLGTRMALAALAKQQIGFGETPEGVSKLGEHPMPGLTRHDGPYVRLDAGGYQRLLSWPLRQVPRVSLADVLAGRTKPEDFAGKTILIGPLARSSKDYFTGALFNAERVDDPANQLPLRSIFGVEVHAQLAAQLILEGRGELPVFQPASSWWTYGLLGLAALGGTLAGALVWRPWASLLVVLGGALLFPAGAWLAMGQGWWVSWIPSLLAWLIAAGLGFLLVAWRETRSRQAISGLFRSYLPPSVADQLWAERDELVDGIRPIPRVLPATVLFSDIRGFTGVAERLQPHELFEWLERFHGQMTDLVTEHGGIVADFMGDGMMAVFGAPIPRTSHEDVQQDAINACHAALMIRETLPKLSAELTERGLPPIGIRIGIHSGNVTAGAIGGRSRLQYALLGDTTNIAARLEQLKDPAATIDDHCRILISAETYALVRDMYQAKLLPLQEPLKGKTRPVQVLRLIGPSEPSSLPDPGGRSQAG
jgi:adenylate cyclase